MIETRIAFEKGCVYGRVYNIAAERSFPTAGVAVGIVRGVFRFALLQFVRLAVMVAAAAAAAAAGAAAAAATTLTAALESGGGQQTQNITGRR